MQIKELISEAEIQRELDRRRPGQSKLTTQRKEEDRCELLSGVFEGRTLGTPIAILVRNKDARPQDYSEIARKFRPSHADYTYEAKYGIRFLGWYNVAHGWDFDNVILLDLRMPGVDGFELHIAPVVLGAGERPLEDVGELRLEQTRAIEAPGVTHVRYRVVR